MIKFKLTSKDGSKSYYKFSAPGLEGILIIDTDSLEASFTKVEGMFKDDESEKEKLLFVAKERLYATRFADSYTYATH